jgi:hypothetical protein
VKRLALLIALLLAAAGSVVQARPTGIYDYATPASGGCGNCHNGVLPNPTPAVRVLIFIDGTAIEQFKYEPDKTYDVTVWVIGPEVPFAGFNLKASAGTLIKKDDTVQTRVLTECGVMEANTFPQCQPGVSGRDCMVKRNAACPAYDPLNESCKRCNAAEEPNSAICRPCDDEAIVDIQATHTAVAAVPKWDLTWTAPTAGAGDVSFYAAGNDVDGSGGPTNDHWNFLEPNPVVVHAVGSAD